MMAVPSRMLRQSLRVPGVTTGGPRWGGHALSGPRFVRSMRQPWRSATLSGRQRGRRAANGNRHALAESPDLPLAGALAKEGFCGPEDSAAIARTSRES